MDHHYCAFVPIAMASSGCTHVVELDGTKVCPVDHGPIPADASFVEAAAAVVRDKFMSVEPDSIEFSLMALLGAGAA